MNPPNLQHLIEALERNNFEVHYAPSLTNALQLFLNKIWNSHNYATVSYADSQTMKQTGVLEFLRQAPEVNFIDTFDQTHEWRTQIAQRKKALSADLFLTGTNAITEKGQLVNLDMIGNRVAALAFGPRHVVLFVGTNKITPNLEAAMERVKNNAAPLNAKQHTDLYLPCQITGHCHDCKSPQRICNTWSITEKSYPRHRIKIILIDEPLGY